MNIQEQIEWLRKMIRRWHEAASPPDQLNRLIEVKDTMEKLNAALGSIAANTCCDKCQEAALVAREALNQTGE